MKLGVTFPQTEIGTDPGVIKAYVQAAEDLGYDYVLVYEHVLGADVSVRPDWLWNGQPPPYTHESMFHEPFVLFGFLGAVTRRINFATGVLVLGQRQTALVAKQAAAVDVLTGGRLRLGVGIGRNDVEYEALNMNFHNRGKRIEEQIELLRAFWTQEVVDFRGQYHTVVAAGINPLPVQRPIPIWFGGAAEPVLRRAARIGDGFFATGGPGDRAGVLVGKLKNYVKELGRDPSSFGIEVGSAAVDQDTEKAVEAAIAWKGLGATHHTLNTMAAGFRRPDDHIRAIAGFKETLGNVFD